LGSLIAQRALNGSAPMNIDLARVYGVQSSIDDGTLGALGSADYGLDDSYVNKFDAGSSSMGLMLDPNFGSEHARGTQRAALSPS
jgi:hypothetical protein